MKRGPKRSDVTHGQLDKVLRSLGFECFPGQRTPPGRIYEHPSGAIIAMPAARDRDRVYEFHLDVARTELDSFGIAKPSIFDAELQKVG